MQYLQNKNTVWWLDAKAFHTDKILLQNLTKQYI